jgi:hypothetical protein
MPAEAWNTPPVTWAGSTPEWTVYWALTQLGYKPDYDFVYQSPQAGGRLEYGGAVIDFYFPEERLAINVQSRYYHYQQAESIMHDAMQRAMMEGWGIRMIYIDEADALANPTYFVKEAIAGRDHSRMGK